MSSFEIDVMEDLYYDEAEGPARQHFDEFDEFGEEEFDEFGEFAEFDEYDEFGEYDAYEADEYEDADMLDAMEEAMVDTLEAEDSDEFFRRLRRGLQRARQIIARTVGRGVARVAPVVSRIASLIPHPAAQAVGRAAAVAGRIGQAISADEFEMLEDMYDLAEDEDAVDAAMPVIAGLTIRRVMPGAAARLSRPARRQLVRSVTQATRAVTRRQGPQAARAIPGVVRTVQTAVRRRRIQPGATPQAIARSPQLIRQMAACAGAAARPGRAAPRRTGGRIGAAGICPRCRRRMVR